jgi:hypothetical protein
MGKMKTINQISNCIKAYQKLHMSDLSIKINDFPSTERHMFKLHFDRKSQITECTIYTHEIDNVAKANFTIFEKLYFRDKIVKTLVQVLMSTIYNMCNGNSEVRELLVDLVYIYKKTSHTEQGMQNIKAEIKDIMNKLKLYVIPFKDNNKYLSKPIITDTSSRYLGKSCSKILLLSLERTLIETKNY